MGNLKRLDTDHPAYQAQESEDWQRVAEALLKEDPSARLCGAEINSINSIVSNNYLDAQDRLIFLSSDTNDAENICEILVYYYEHQSNPVQFGIVEKPRRLIGLKDSNVEDFQKKGLKNLVQQISTDVRCYSSDAIAINATGGYKAQISFAGMIGQALGIPVYYLFERFSKVIELPPQPIALDLSLWLNHYVVFDKIATADSTRELVEAAQVEIDLQTTSLDSMIEKVPIDEVSYLTLSAMGTLFHERCRLQFERQKKTLLALIPQDEVPPEKKKIFLRDDHGKEYLKKFSKKIIRSPFVKGIVNSLPFNPKQISPIRRVTNEGLVEFVLTWTDPGYGLCIQTTGRNQIETNTIAIHLEREFT
ncbi:MAG: putative CRISPR-associated protein [Cyanobacteria bacterium P01_H01_bin.105]